MTNRIRVLTASVIVSLLGGLLIAASPPANAEDVRHCVSKREFYGTKPGTRAEIEAAWDVTNRGYRSKWDRDRRLYKMLYVACGYRFHEEAEIAVFYWKSNDEASVIYRWIYNDHGATLHGHERFPTQ